MNMLNRGSLLIELIIYLVLVGVLGLCAFTWFTRSQRQLLRSGQSSNVLMQLYSATDLLIRDLRASPRASDAWIVRGPSALVWRTPDGDVGWYVQKKALYRIEGSYNSQSAKWAKRTRSLAIQGLEQIDMQAIQEHDEIDHIEVTLVVASGGVRHTAHECVYPRKELV